MYCPNCGKILKVVMNYCHYCGKKLEEKVDDKEKIENIKREINNMLIVLDHTLVNEIDQAEYWGSEIRLGGNHDIVVIHYLDQEFVYVQYKIQFNKETIRKLDELIDKSGEFFYGLRSILNSPFTDWALIKEDNKVIGFGIFTKILIDTEIYIGKHIDYLEKEQEYDIWSTPPPKCMYQ